jgi:hypothetical protein
MVWHPIPSMRVNGAGIVEIWTLPNGSEVARFDGNGGFNSGIWLTDTVLGHRDEFRSQLTLEETLNLLSRITEGVLNLLN